VLEILVLFCNVVELHRVFFFFFFFCMGYKCSLHFLFGKNFERATRIVDQRGVKRISGEPSGRFIFQVKFILYLHPLFVPLWIDMFRELASRWFNPDLDRHHKVVLG
jgi:hypothetical protein